MNYKSKITLIINLRLHDYIYIYKVVISVLVFFVCLPYHNSETPGLICLKFNWGNRETHVGMFLAWF